MTHIDPTETRRGPGAPDFARFLVKLITLLILAVVTVPLWPLYWLGCLIWRRPPNVPHVAQVKRYLRLVWTVDPPPPGLSTFARVWITLSIVRKVLLTPVLGLMWLLDELLYGRALDATPVVAPLLEISAGRSGSTQIARYLEEDPRLVAPNLLQSMFPYLWLWRLVPQTIGRFVTPDMVRRKIAAMMPPELLERHEGDPFKTDTFDGAFYSFHLNALAYQLGPDAAAEELNFAKFAPHNRELLEADFVRLLDRVGRKTLLYAGSGPVGRSGSGGNLPRFFVKGHFLSAADALARHYPGACFLTVIREPASRLRSAVNYLRVNPADPVLGPIPWPWLASALERTEVEYCEVERAWFMCPSGTQLHGPRRCVVRFSDFVEDLRGAMRHVYRTCWDEEELPPHIPAHHPPRERRHYTVDRSLAELGIDADALRARLASYVAWCEGENVGPRGDQVAI